MRANVAKRVAVKEDGAHSSVVGGSTAKLRRKCPKSIDEERHYPRETSIFADTGTALHKVMEEALRDCLTFPEVLANYDGVVIRESEMQFDVDLTADLLHAKIKPALEYFDEQVPITARHWLERKMHLTAYIPEGKGTGDVVFDDTKHSGRAGVLDWKFGDGWIVEAEDNDQGRFYICAAILSGYLPDNLPEYEFHIFQPAAKLEPHQYGKKAVYKADDLWDFLDDLTDAIDLWRSGNAKHNPGDHCAMCKGKLGCPAYRQLLTTAVATDIPSMTTADLAKHLDTVPGILSWVKDLQAAAFRNAQAGLTVPGWTLEPALGNHTWKDEKSAANALGRLGLSDKERTKKSVISAPQALEALRKLGVPEREFERFKQRHVHRLNNGERLVRAKPGAATGGALERLGNALSARGL